MITSRMVQECGKADYGWLQARYTFSFGHYFDPQLLGYASLRVLNQEVLAPGASFQARSYPEVDVLNLVLLGEAEYRDSRGNHTRASSGEVLLLSTHPGISYSECNLSNVQPLTRMQLWLDACPERDNTAIQRIALAKNGGCTLLASPDGMAQSLQLRQQIWIHHLEMKTGETQTIKLHGSHAYVQSIHGNFHASTPSQAAEALACGDGAFIRDDPLVTLVADTPLRALVIDLPA
ncbi:pirin family protein [Erwinia psidii]|uniref:Pirin family protein n=1 Tax=Erwinia psidii TaxID=69224 RepID=A0A3N6UZ32_9GAMM|nr:pirin family protein [Erwinia psidii]MCX8958204.1 pirin family protein [Erwinia psidii]MCX8963427.1 pirin family protein [Erwinia psidii]MCX8966941.1 pirin family protein [Erwinia psidii]RQM38065.1 pirin family protein [Erwinia psidii]